MTGGAISRGNIGDRRQEKRAYKDERRSLKREYKDQRRMARGKAPRGPRVPRGQRRRKGGIIKKILQKDVLYLIIVNLPTEAEYQQSVADLERMDTARLRAERGAPY